MWVHKLVSDIKLRPWISLSLVCLVAATVMWPMLRLRWDLVDDGVSFASAQLIENALRLGDPSIAEPVFIERHFVRFRPVYWVWFWLIFHFFGHNYLVFHLIKVLFFVASAALAFTLIFQLTKSTKASMVAALLYILQLHDLPNWYYLSHHEAFLNVYMLSALVGLVTVTRNNLNQLVKKVLLCLFIFTLPLIFWSKETSIALFIPIGFQLAYTYFWAPRTEKSSFKYWLIFLLGGALCSLVTFGTLKYLSLSQPEGYFSQYKVSENNDLAFYFRLYRGHLLNNFTWLYLIPIGTFLWSWVSSRHLDKVRAWQLFFLLAHVCFFAILLPFSLRTESYYLANSNLFYCLFVGLEAYRLFSLQKSWIQLSVLCLVAFILIRNSLFIASYVSEFVTVQLTNSQVMEKVVAYTPAYKKVLFNFSEADRGYINGIITQRASIYPCGDLVVTDPEVIFGVKNVCHEQYIGYYHNQDSTVKASEYDLLVVGDTSRSQLLMPLAAVEAQGVSLTLIDSVSGSASFLDRSVMLEEWLLSTCRQVGRNLKLTLQTRRLHMPIQPYPSRTITPRWDFYKIETDI